MKVLFTFTLLISLLNRGIFASNPVKGFIFQCPDTDTAVSIKFTGDEETKDKESTLTNIVPNPTQKITKQLMQTSTILMDTIIPVSKAKVIEQGSSSSQQAEVIEQGSSSSQQLAHPLTSTFQLIHGGKYERKYYKFGAKQLVYERRFVAKETMPIIVFSFHQPFVRLVAEQAQNQDIVKLFDSIRTICKSAICMSYLPLTEAKSFDPNVCNNLNFRSHFFYNEESANVPFPKLWYLIHDKNFAVRPMAENTDLIDTTNIGQLQDSIIAATNFVYKSVDSIIQDGSIKPSPRDIDLAKDRKIANFLDTTIPKSISNPVYKYKFCEIEPRPNPVQALTNKELGRGAFGEIFLGKNLNVLKRVAVKMGSEDFEHESHQAIHQQMTLYFKNNARENDVVPIATPGPRHMKLTEIETKYKYAMECLGPNLSHDSLLEFCRKFPILCYREIVLQMLERVFLLQEIGVIHNDLKPANFLFGLGHLKQFVYLTDFGTVQNFAKILNDNPQQLTGQGFIGTYRFASIAAHNGLQISWRDEYESLGYGIIELVKGLPFYYDTVESYLDEKIKLNDKFWNSFPGVEYGKKPNYQFLVGCIKRAILEGGDPSELPKFKTKEKLFGIDLSEWNQIPVIEYKKVGKPIGLLAAKLSANKPTLFIDEKLLFCFSQNQEDLYYIDYVVTNAGEKDEYVMILPGIEEMASLICSDSDGKSGPFLCIMIVDDANGNSFLQKGSYVSTLIKSTMSRDEFQSKVLDNGNTKNPVYQAIDSKAPNTDRITNVPLPSGNFTDELVQQHRTTMIDIGKLLLYNQSPTK